MLTYDNISLGNAIVHRRVEDTLAVWIYDPLKGQLVMVIHHIYLIQKYLKAT